MDGFAGAPFQASLFAYPVAMHDRESNKLEEGGKVILPQSALEQLVKREVTYPMLFELRNLETNKITHCGVQEFSAEEGTVFMPYWMMQNLYLREGDRIRVTNVTLKKARFAKFQPQSTAFLEITDPKTVLEFAMRKLSALTEGEVIRIVYNRKTYDILVVEVKPKDSSKGVSIIETDMEVDFQAPVGYEEPKRPEPKPDSSIPGGFGFGDSQEMIRENTNEQNQPEDNSTAIQFGYSPFAGSGYSLRGKGESKRENTIPVKKQEEKQEEKEGDKWANLGKGYSLK